MPRMIFVGDMGDVFSAKVPLDYLYDEIVAIAGSANGERHLWLLLTKKARRMAVFAQTLAQLGVSWPKNLWAGVSITSLNTVRRARWLSEVPAPVRFVSYEPALGPITIDFEIARPNWIIAGGESGPKARSCDLGWLRSLRSLRDNCRDTGTPLFIKQLGSLPRNPPLNDAHGGDWSEWLEELRVREMPRWPPANAREPTRSDIGHVMT